MALPSLQAYSLVNRPEGDMTMKNEHEDEYIFILSVSDKSGFSQNAHDVVVDNGPAVGVMWPVHCFIGSWSPSLLARNTL